MSKLESEQELYNYGEDIKLCCPNCGHTELYYEAGMKLGRLYHCKRCGYIGTFVIEANPEMRQLIQSGMTQKIDDNPFTAKEYIPIRRILLYSFAVVFVILCAINIMFPEYSTTISLIWPFLSLGFIIVFVYLKYR